MGHVDGSLELTEAPVLVIDCQTTGSRPSEAQVIELAWCHVVPDRALTVESRLVRLAPGQRIPRAVSRITGLDAVILEREGVTEAEAWAELVAAAPAPATPTVIHYASFERAFVDDLALRHGPHPAPFDMVCTHAIAKRLLPDLPRHTLRALAGYYGHGAHLLRRSSGHVEATVHVWRELVAELAAHDVHRWDELARFLVQKRARRSTKKGVPLLRATRLALPDAPGIYRFVRRDGSVLYVGKAISLKRRVNSYFAGHRSQRPHTQEMLAQAADVEVVVTDTALEASLLETDRIKEDAPPYNLALLDADRSAWFATPTLRDLAPAADARHRVGPLPSRWAVAPFVVLCDVLDRADDTPSLLARALGESVGAGPTRDELDRGVALFEARYPSLRRSWARVPSLLHHGKLLAELDAQHRLDPGETNVSPGPRPWDAERVARHIERTVLQASRALRRARWLCLLSESSVAFHEPGHPTTRLLRIARGVVAERAFVPPERSLPVPPGHARPLAERQGAMDLAVYDRLRVLSTELKRLTQQSDDVRVRVGPRPPLSGHALRRVLLLC